MSSHLVVNKSKLDSKSASETDEEKRFIEALNHVCSRSDVVVIDAPGNDTFLSRLAHSYADTVITPINDSFVDLNMVVQTDDETFAMNRHGLYSEIVWQAKMQKAKRNGGEIDWVITRNRLSHIDARNKRNMFVALENFSKRSGARIAEGLSERVIYKELFLKGMTLLDVVNEDSEIDLTMSHVAARQELRRFIDFLNLKDKLEARKQERLAKAQQTTQTAEAEQQPAETASEANTEQQEAAVLA